MKKKGNIDHSPEKRMVSSSSRSLSEGLSFRDGSFGNGLSFSKVEYEADFRTAGSSEAVGSLLIEMTGSSTADSDPLRSLLIDMDRRTDPKLGNGLRGPGDTVFETDVECLFGPNGKRDRKERKAGMPEGVLGGFAGGEGDDATERFGVSLVLVDADGMVEGKALRLGCTGIDEGGERWGVVMMTT